MLFAKFTCEIKMPRAYLVKKGELCQTPTAPSQGSNDVIEADFAEVPWMEKIRSWKDAGSDCTSLWLSGGQDSREVDDVGWRHGHALLAERTQLHHHTTASRDPLGENGTL